MHACEGYQSGKVHLFLLGVHCSDHLDVVHWLKYAVQRGRLVEALVRQSSFDLVCGIRKQRGLRVGVLDKLHQGHTFVYNGFAIFEGWHLAARVDRQDLVALDLA